jgi:hypothetical protein
MVLYRSTVGNLTSERTKKRNRPEGFLYAFQTLTDEGRKMRENFL